MRERDDNDGFILVKSKGKSKNRIQPSTNLPQDDSHVSLEYVNELHKKILKCKADLKQNDSELYVSKMLFTLKKIVSSFFESYPSGQKKAFNIICYGIGSIDDSFTSRFQLALLLLVIDELNETTLIEQVSHVEFYDPVFNKADRILLEEKLGFTISKENEQCLKQVQWNGDLNSYIPTLFYMPHCPKSLYNNLLYSNWSPDCLQSIIILGNSFSTIQSVTNEDVMWSQYNYVLDSLRFVSEIKIDHKCDFTNDFYDLNFHVFNCDNSTFEFSDSSRLKKPVYDKSDEIV
jgi:hypothetical protein